MRIWLVGALILTLTPQPGSAQTPSFTVAQGTMRRSMGGWAERRFSRRNSTIDTWIAGPAYTEDDDEEKVVIQCDGRPCPPERTEQILFLLAGYLERVPAFLKGTSLTQVIWNEVPAGRRPVGDKDGRTITLTVPRDQAVDGILVHEIAHVYHDDHADAVRDFLKLRLKTDAMQQKLAELWMHVWRLNAGRHQAPYDLDDIARRMVSAMRLPRRHAGDIHAATKDTEYWAVSVELAYGAWKNGEWSGLQSFLDAAEVSYLRQAIAG
ncbi:MAG: hypothetical protein ABIJ96_06915 [Elusimicrobiota bacterium]